jgi:hypothetical protein
MFKVELSIFKTKNTISKTQTDYNRSVNPKFKVIIT